MEKKKIIAIRDFILSAEKSVKNAKKLLKEVLDESGVELKDITLDTEGLKSYKDEDSKVIEWVFTWEDMLGSDGHKYPVPANYCSKSKMVQGDKLKVTIDPSGKMMYKQISPIEREIKIWLLTKDKDRFQVVVEWDVYNVLTAAVTHYKWNIWDNVSIIVPAWKAATYAAIEAILPKGE